MSLQSELGARACATAAAVARALGLAGVEPVLLANRSNALVHLRPAPVVARVATTTALVRPDARAYLERELALAGYLASRGAAVVPPSDLLPPGPHAHDGLSLTFWRYVEHERTPPAPAEAGRALVELHAALRGYPGPLPGPVASLDEATRLLAGLSGAYPEADLGPLRDEHARLAPLLRAAGPSQPLHGDAHAGNLLRTAGGLVWADLEDTWRGPIGWDLGCLCWGQGPAALAGYPGAPDWEALAPFVAARDLQATVWLLNLARSLPDRAERARTQYAAWRSRLA